MVKMPRVTVVAVIISVISATRPHPLLDPEACWKPLLDPVACCTLKSPPLWTAVWTTSAGEFELQINRSAAPLGVDRFYNLVTYGYFQNTSNGVPQPGNKAGFFRVVPGFVVQFGIAGDPAVSAAWQNLNLKDDPVLMSNTLGTIAYATAGPDTRTTQVYINLGDNSRLDKEGFAPFGVVTKGMNVVNLLYAGCVSHKQKFARAKPSNPQKYSTLQVWRKTRPGPDLPTRRQVRGYARARLFFSLSSSQPRARHELRSSLCALASH